ncbi:MAG: ABC transporter permease [Thermomicrobiales bacterium]
MSPSEGQADVPRPRRALGWAPPVLLVVGALLAWQLWVDRAGVKSWLLPSPSVIAKTLVGDRGLLLSNASTTLWEVLLGFAAALAVGVLVAVAIDASATVDRAVYPLVVASQAVPVIALAPLLLTWFGYGIAPKVIVVALLAFFPIVVNTVDGLRSADRESLDMLKTFGAGRWARFWMVKAPGAMPGVFSGARIGVAVSVIGAVFGEYVGSKAGLGYLINISNAQFNTPRVFAAIVVLAVMAMALFGAVAMTERLALPWRRFTTSARNDR